MRIRKRTLGILAALGIATSTLLAPQANAATLTIEGDVCTVSPSVTDGDRLVAYFAEWSENLISELKKDVPAATSDIDYVVNNITFSEEYDPEVDAALARVVTASLTEGFWNVDDDPEAAAVLVFALIIEENSSLYRTDQVFFRSTVPTDPPDTENPVDPGSISPALQRLFQNAVPSNAEAIADWYAEIYAACRDGVPGTYNIGTGGGGGGGGGGNGGGGFGSGGSSFGSS